MEAGGCEAGQLEARREPQVVVEFEMKKKHNLLAVVDGGGETRRCLVGSRAVGKRLLLT